MRSQPKRFVVELKRGTNRAAFASADPAAERFSSAEQALFGSAPQPGAGPNALPDPRAAKPGGRVLPSLIEPPPPVVEIPEPPRRGRKPGSKNRPKVPPPAPEAAAPAPRLAFDALSAEARAFAERPAARPAPAALPAPCGEFSPAAPKPAVEGANRNAEEVPGRLRFRERSGIIKRYVLGTAPQPGQPGYARLRRAARAGV